ncbi:hypothetical protein TNCV_3289361 [Trichonephila clavipes]|nr:hypothetical protein TNCV_3289361 [Trichonephila clavipes]
MAISDMAISDMAISDMAISDMAISDMADTAVATPLSYKIFWARHQSWHRTATAGSDVVQSGRPIFDDFSQHLWPYIGNNTTNVVFQMVKHLWLIRIDQ